MAEGACRAMLDATPYINIYGDMPLQVLYDFAQIRTVLKRRNASFPRSKSSAPRRRKDRLEAGIKGHQAIVTAFLNAVHSLPPPSSRAAEADAPDVDEDVDGDDGVPHPQVFRLLALALVCGLP